MLQLFAEPEVILSIFWPCSPESLSLHLKHQTKSRSQQRLTRTVRITNRKMKKMTGIILMISGIILFSAGLILYKNPKGLSKKEQVANKVMEHNVINPQSNPGKNYEIPVEELSINSSKQNDDIIAAETNQAAARAPSMESMEHIIQMAIADGILTNNERNLIKQQAEKIGLDYVTVIAEVETRMDNLDFASETQLIDFNKKSGDDFEKFVVQKFNPRFFKLKEWAGDKYVDGIYAETTLQPDLLFDFTIQGKTDGFAVECKWRSDFKRGGIEFATKSQFQRYQRFGQDRNISVFIAIGVGGKPESPQYFYVVPLSELTSNFINSATLKNYGKRLESNFFFDQETQVLK
jgi:hypothetical protein